MAFTRIKNDPEIIKKYLQQSTDQGRWQINVPGKCRLLFLLLNSFHYY